MLVSVYLAIALLGMGLFYIGLAFFKIPDINTNQAVLSLSRSNKSRGTSLSEILLVVAAKIAPYIPVTSYKERRMAMMLRAVGIKRTPRVYIAQALLKGCMLSLVLLPTCFISFPLFVTVLLISTLVFFRELDQPAALLKEKREKVEVAVPRLVADIAQQLKSTRDIVFILEAFAENETDTLAQEIRLTVADIKSSSLEPALGRLESRINSSMLSEMVRGLLAVDRGEANADYFAILANRFKEIEVQRLKLIASKRPERVSLYNFLLVGCFIVICVVVLFTDVISNVSMLF